MILSLKDTIYVKNKYDFDFIELQIKNKNDNLRTKFC